jgi:hypothetical protein
MVDIDPSLKKGYLCKEYVDACRLIGIASSSVHQTIANELSAV